MEIKRNIHLERLIKSKHNGMIKVMTGIRRCGKSYLLMNLFRQHLLDGGVNESHIIMRGMVLCDVGRGAVGTRV